MDFVTDKKLCQMGPAGPLQSSSDARSGQPEKEPSIKCHLNKAHYILTYELGRLGC